MNVGRTVAALRTDRQPDSPWRIRRALRRPARRLPAVPRASARVRSAACCRGAFGRWRCRWTAPFPVDVGDHLAVGIGQCASRCRTSPDAWWCARCWRGRDERGAARRPGMIGSRRARMRSSGICSGSVTRPVRRAPRGTGPQPITGANPATNCGRVSLARVPGTTLLSCPTSSQVPPLSAPIEDSRGAVAWCR
jgi:hypothetical protein